MSENNTYQTALTKISNTYFPMIEKQLTGNNIEMDDYSKRCVMNAISSINNTLEIAGIDWNHPQLDQSNITQTLLNIASLKLNSSAHPNEVFFQVRNVKTGKKDGKGKDVWKKQIEMGIEGDGNDAILSNFGRDVKQVMNYWVVRENDQFEYPSYVGLEMQPPKWTPTGKGKVVRVVYPIIKKNDVVEYHIAEREDVIKNLIAHIKNNLMNETFGIAKNRFDATPAQKTQIAQKKKEIIAKAEELGLDKALNDEELQKHISPAWKDPQSRETMITRKMRNNVVKKIPKDFNSTFVEISYEDSTSDYKEQTRKEIQDNANSEVIDIEPEESPSHDDNKPQNEPQESEIVSEDINISGDEKQPEDTSNEPQEDEMQKDIQEYMQEVDHKSNEYIEDDVPF